MKNKQLNTWFWRWHIISALIILPVVIVLTVTGIIYLYKADFNNWVYKEQRFIVDGAHSAPYSFQQQLEAVDQFIAGKSANKLRLSKDDLTATTFYLAGKGHAKHAVYVNPYSLEVQGDFLQKDSLMYLVRKLHGELLLGLPGTLIVELVACWLIVMLLTGFYLWWPQKSWRVLGFFWIRTKDGSRVLWRDLHVTLGFYSCLMIFIILLGGLPWTEVFGGAYKNIQQQTYSGYPEGWRSVKVDAENNEPLDLDQMVAIAQSQQLPGDVVIHFKQKSNAFTVSNRSFYLKDQQRLHFNKYNGDLVAAYDWQDVGVMMQLRQFLMRFHQGQYGLSNWYLVLIASLLFLFSNVAGLVSYLKRKSKGSWSLPQNKNPIALGYSMIVLMVLLAIMMPLFGLSLLLIVLAMQLKKISVSDSSKY